MPTHPPFIGSWGFAPDPILVVWIGFTLFHRIALNPPGCGALFLRRGAGPACKKQTAAPAPLRLFLPQAAPQLRSPPPFICSPGPAGPILLRLANFPGGRRCALVKIGALRQLRLAASAAGSARLSCPIRGLCAFGCSFPLHLCRNC